MKYSHRLYVQHQLVIEREPSDPPLFIFEPPRRQRMLVERIVFGKIDVFGQRLSSQIIYLQGYTLLATGEPSNVQRDEVTTLDHVPANVLAMWLDWRDAKFKAADAAIGAANDHERRREADYAPVTTS